MPVPSRPAPPSLPLRETGRRAARLVLPGSDWVHRRVQRVSYLDPGMQRMQLSVDFTVPRGTLGTHLPISVLPKWPPLYRLDFKAADGTPVPLLTTEQNGEVDEGLLRELVALVSPSSLESDRLVSAMRTLAWGSETDLFRAFVDFFDDLDLDLADPRAVRTVEVAAMLTDTTLLWYPVGPLSPGTRVVCKVQYLIRSEPDIKWWERIARALSWYQPAEYLRLWHAGADANFHADVEVPKLLTIRDADPRYYRFVPEASVEVDGEIEEEEEVYGEGKRPEQHLDISGRLAHLYMCGRRPLAVDLYVRFAPTRTGVVLSSFLASLLIAALTTFFYLWRHQAAEPANVDASVAVLILVPALIGYLVVRPADHPISRRYIVGVQLVSAAAAAIPLGMAVLLIRYATEPAFLHPAWRWATYVSWVLVAVLFLSLAGAGSGWRRSVREEDH